MDCSSPDSSVHEISQAKSELPLSSPGNLPNPGIKPESSALAGGFSTTELHGKSPVQVTTILFLDHGCTASKLDCLLPLFGLYPECIRLTKTLPHLFITISRKSESLSRPPGSWVWPPPIYSTSSLITISSLSVLQTCSLKPASLFPLPRLRPTSSPP